MMLDFALHPLQQLGVAAFSVHWSTVVGLVLFGWWYVWRARQGARMLPPGVVASPTPTQRALFFAGLLVIFFSLNGPLHDLSDGYLFSAHMVQHLLLTLIMPPLLIAGTPGWMLRPALQWPIVGPVVRAITKPAACFAIFNIVLAGWHLPVLYNIAMAHHNVHIVEHLMFMMAAVLMWWPLMSPMPELPRLPYPWQVLYCFLMGIPMSIVAVYISYADHILYPFYASAPRVWGLSPMDDQMLGGLIMWVPGGIVFYVVMTVVFFKWVKRNEDSRDGAQVDWTPPASRAP